MQNNIFVLFKSRSHAESAINHLHHTLHIPADQISYIYKDHHGEKVTREGDGTDTNTTGEGALTGATTGGAIGAVIGLVGVAGLLGPLGPVVVAGPLATALGITGAIGAVVGTGLTGAALGGIVGALTAMGVSETVAREYEVRVDAGDVLVSIHTDDTDTAVAALRQFNPSKIEVVEDTY